ncbi:Highly reducing polyketide synthase azaB [Lachnellula suecica]|uniref:Highly reducing polyketide synthase azaB n=1 Tax=Lachnellula suecica TaxID=602035 RepID=A0A8T9C443_9HELO|nr:Highly reducing polyketide synthase azaB [Lachnellula suecica]
MAASNGPDHAQQPNGFPSHAVQQDILEPIAIIGLSLRYPQDATSPASFWEMIQEKRCAMTEVPKDRFDIDAFYHPDKDRRNTVYARGGHFIKDDVTAFDAPFFSITVAEAEALDPQQRLLLETTYQAIENAGISLEKALGSKTGVYTGSMTDDYKMQLLRDLEEMPKYAATGVSMALVANRVSWFFDFHGPSVNFDSACSSSLMALDIACQDLRAGASNMALVAGCSLILSIEPMLSLTNMGFLSPDSRCYSFDDRANGYARGEGIGTLVIKRLSDAIKDNDTIRAVIRSTGCNSDGRTPGITQPSKVMQESLIKETYEKAGLDLHTTRYFEAHGTGTAIGDPIEADAIGSVFRTSRTPTDPLYVGSVKANIGHLEGGSGIAGIIKTVMVLEKGIIPPLANFENLNSKIDAEFWNLRFPTEPTPWPSKGLRRASVNSFGFGGSNAHCVMEDAYNFLDLRNLEGNHCTTNDPSLPTIHASNGKATNGTAPRLLMTGKEDTQLSTNGYSVRENNSSSTTDTNGTLSEQHTADNNPEGPSTKLLVWSAADEDGLTRLAEAYSSHFRDLNLEAIDEDIYLKDLAYTLDSKRSALPWKSFLLTDSLDRLTEMKPMLSAPVRSSKNPAIAFVFTGQGAQYSRMGLELMCYPIFREVLQSIDNVFRTLGCKWSLIDELAKEVESSNIDDPEYAQPLCTALQIALVETLRHFGIVPSAVIGHSSGEIAAAYTVGGLSLESASQVAYFRGQVAGNLKRSGQPPQAMMSVNLSEKELEMYLQRIGLFPDSGSITVACINSPSNVTVSGAESAIDILKSHLDISEIFARKIPTGVAYHSPQMNQVVEEYISLIQGLERGKPAFPRISMISSTTGDPVSNTKTLSTPEYWAKNMVQPVRFSDAVERLMKPSHTPATNKLGATRLQEIPNELMEIGPHTALQRPVKDILKGISMDETTRYHSVLSRFQRPIKSTLEIAGRLYAIGFPVNLSNVNQLESGTTKLKTLPDLPGYPFNHSRTYRQASRLSKNICHRVAPHRDLLGAPVEDWNPLEPRWRKTFDVAETPWILDHVVNGKAIYPAAGMVVMAVEAAKQMAIRDRPIAGFRLRDTTFSNPIIIRTQEPRTEVQLYLRCNQDKYDKEASTSEFRLCVYENENWKEVCKGTIRVEYEQENTEVDHGHEKEQEIKQLVEEYEKAVRSCDRSVAKERMYHTLTEVGLAYGSSFQGLQNLSWDGDRLAVGEIKSFDWAAQETQNHVQPHLIHPSTLDAVAQLAWVSLTKGATSKASTSIPTRLHECWLSGSGLGFPDVVTLRGCNVSSLLGPQGSQGIDSTAFALDQDGNLKISVSHLESTTVSSIDSTSQALLQRQLCYNLEWKPDSLLIPNEDVPKVCQPAEPGPDEPVEFFDNLGLVLFSFILRVLDEIDSDDQKNAKPHLQKYITWMKHQVELFDAGELPNGSPDWKTRSMNTGAIELLTQKIENSNASGKLHVTIGRNLLAIIRGSVNPLELLFSDDLAANHYELAIDSGAYCDYLEKYLDLLAHKNPELRIVEIGAGTGSFTKHAIPPLLVHGENELGTPRFAHYDYTDVSAGFFEKAKESWISEQERMDFKILNIEQDPRAQGFDSGTYDLVIAGSVLHATQDLIATVQNCRKLLKPGGKMILHEAIQPDFLGTAFSFGTLPGWWLSKESFRNNGPCISREQWGTLLSQNGFSGVDCLFQDYENRSCHELGIMVTTAVPTQNVEETADLSLRVVLVIDPKCSFQGELASLIRRELESQGILECSTIPLHEILSVQNPKSTFFIFLPETEHAFIYGLEYTNFNLLKNFADIAQRLLWVTCVNPGLESSPELDMVTGFARVLRSENSNCSLITLTLERGDVDLPATARTIAKVLKANISTTSEEYETEYAERDGQLLISRAFEAENLDQELYANKVPQLKEQRLEEEKYLSLEIGTPGLLDTLQFVHDSDNSKPLGPDEVEIEVKCFGLQFRNVLIALGRMNEATMGSEFAGLVTKVGANCKSFQSGDRVCGGITGTWKTYTRCNSQLIVKIPDFVSWEEAASFPIGAVTAYLAFVKLARLQKGESVLIHAGSGGTGQLAIQMAQNIGAEVFVTVGFDEKKQLLMTEYNIPEDHIFYSRNTAFAKGILRMTQNRGVDVVLNSLSGDSLVTSFESIAPFGRFIEIGKRDIDSNSGLPMSSFSKNVTFSALAVDEIIRERPAVINECLTTVMGMLEKNILSPARPLHKFAISEMQEAFRLMQGGKSSGKIVLTLSPADHVPTLLYRRPSYILNPVATYLIAGGLGGLGRSAAIWMAQRGAKNLILLSRSGPASQSAAKLLTELRNIGVRVEAPKCDVSSRDSLKDVLSTFAKSMPPIEGCVQGTMVLKDALFHKMSFEEWNLTTNSKVASTKNLHELLPSDLSFFIMLSSLAGIAGPIGQANYAAGNAYQDALAKFRVSQGQKAVSLRLGLMGDIGIVAEKEEYQDRKDAMVDMAQISEAEFHTLLEYYCNPDLGTLSSVTCQPLIGLVTPMELRSRGFDVPYWMQRPTFRALNQIGLSKSTSVSADPGSAIDYLAKIKAASSTKEIGDIVVEALVGKLSKALAIPTKDIDVTKPLHAYGVDSLLAVELRNWFAKEIKADLAVFDIMGASSIVSVGALAAGRAQL